VVIIPSEWDIFDLFKKTKRWYTTKEIILEFKYELTSTNMVTFNRKINHLLKFNKIKFRVCQREIAWRHENEYKIQ